MGWWRRDPSVWSRMAIHPFPRRKLLDHEADLRSRCFSKPNAQTATHGNDENDRSSKKSNLQWAQLEAYERWKQSVEKDPYRALFGASESMLNGKGLRDWQWVVQTFPGWMVKEVETEEKHAKGGKDECN